MRRYFFALALAMTLNHVACGADNNATGGTSPAETPLKQANSMKIRLRIEKSTYRHLDRQQNRSGFRFAVASYTDNE